MLTGILEADAESFIVRTADGGRMVVPRRRVVLVARDEPSAYAHLAHRVADHDVAARVRLIQWCLEHRLLAAAEVECTRLGRVSPNHPELESLAARLRFLRDGPEPSSRPAGRHSPPRIDEAPRPDIPDSSVADFTRRIQPLLMNACATATCHGRAAESTFTLSPPLKGLHFTKRLTERNLQSVLRQLSFVSAESSPLLRMAEMAHGDLSVAPLPEKAPEQRDSLRTWIADVTGQSLDVVDDERVDLADGPVRSPNSSSAVLPASHTAPVPSATTPIPTAHGSRPVHSSSRDPFDPAAFNDG